MRELSEKGQSLVRETALQHGFSEAAVRVMLDALARGHGNQAQFDHPEFGGMGQWSSGGMTMVGDMFNHGLKARVDGLCRDLSQAFAGASVFAASQSQSQSQGSGEGAGGSGLYLGQTSTGWPAELGRPASEGAQNDMRYAFFPETRRLAISVGGKIRVYDTGDHRIGGFGQAQGGGQSLSFTSQHGPVRLSDLELVDRGDAAAMDVEDRAEKQPAPLQGAAMPGSPDVAKLTEAPPADMERTPPHDPREAAAMPGTPPVPPAPAEGPAGGLSDEQIFARLERLADFHARGILDDAEFAAKKAELLARL